jgi:hypothetical protein
MDAIFLSWESEISFIFSRDTVIPPWIEEAPGNAVWPPPLMANGHCVSRDNSTTVDTSNDVLGLKMQYGLTDAA